MALGEEVREVAEADDAGVLKWTEVRLAELSVRDGPSRGPGPGPCGPRPFGWVSWFQSARISCLHGTSLGHLRR
eukprot:12427981-Karenia_brevis.AAC.1